MYYTHMYFTIYVYISHTHMYFTVFFGVSLMKIKVSGDVWVKPQSRPAHDSCWVPVWSGG